MQGTIEYISPDTMHKNPAFSQAVITHGPGKTIYIGGQNGVDIKGEIVDKNDLVKQTGQAMKNFQLALEASLAGWENVIKMNIYIVQGGDLASAYKAAQPFMTGIKKPPIVTVLFVAALGRPDFLIEIDGIAYL
ncbi:RidA family protein [Pollutibacter soli]|uniref:RidA family protein n=1 Tax=Pollutibacter soli TaxID=3034157 RepID=UPI003013A076